MKSRPHSIAEGTSAWSFPAHFCQSFFCLYIRHQVITPQRKNLREQLTYREHLKLVEPFVDLRKGAARRLRFLLQGRSSSSISIISLCRASYISCPRVPFSSCSLSFSCAVFSASSFSFVALIASFRSFCFWVTRFVLAGPSLRSLFTSFREDCVVLIVEFTLFRPYQADYITADLDYDTLNSTSCHTASPL